MCGRFTLSATPDAIRSIFDWLEVPDEMPPRYNIAPTQPVAVVANNRREKLDFFTWGLLPSWAKDPKMGARMINARAETLAEKPSFRTAYKRRRCLIPADGFYEWVKIPGQKIKVPHYIQLASGEPFAFAGLWEYWQGSDGSEIKSCTIITTEPNDLISKLHNRMPVILDPESYDLWLDPGELGRERLDPLLKAYPAEAMKHHAVTTLVNSPANDMPGVIQPA